MSKKKKGVKGENKSKFVEITHEEEFSIYCCHDEEGKGFYYKLNSSEVLHGHFETLEIVLKEIKVALLRVEWCSAS